MKYPKPTVKELIRFLNKIDFGEYYNCCWLWTAFKDKDGYGRFGIKSKSYNANSISLEWLGGGELTLESPFALHSCDNPSCVNPNHLKSGNNQDNMNDMKSRGRQNKPKGLKNGKHTKPKSRSYGDRNGSRIHIKTRPRGETHKSSKLDNNLVQRIFELRKQGLFQKDIAEQIGCTQCHISRVLLGTSWGHKKDLLFNKDKIPSLVKSNNTSGFTGVSWRSDSHKWKAYIQINNKRVILGNYDNNYSAAVAYNIASTVHNNSFKLNDIFSGEVIFKEKP